MRRQQLGYTLAIVTISAVALASNTERALFGGPAVPAAFAALPGAADGAVSQNGFVAGGPRDGSFGAATGFPRRGASVGPVSGLPARLAGVPAGSVPTGSVSGDDAAAAAPDGAAPTVLADNGPVASRGGIASFADGAGGLPALGGLLSGGGGGGQQAPAWLIPRRRRRPPRVRRRRPRPPRRRQAFRRRCRAAPRRRCPPIRRRPCPARCRRRRPGPCWSLDSRWSDRRCGDAASRWRPPCSCDVDRYPHVTGALSPRQPIPRSATIRSGWPA